MNQTHTRRNVLMAVTAVLALGIGGVALHGQTPSFAQAQTTAQTKPTFDPKRARTENERNTVDVVQAAQDGLVYVSVVGRSSDGTDGGSQPDPFAGTPFQGMPGLPGGQGRQDAPTRGTGSGFFVDARGDIITNYHVVQGATTITLHLHNRPGTFTAKVVGTAPDYDLALIRAENLPAGAAKPIPLGDSDGLAPGLKAIALGAPFGLDFSVSEGIISAVGRKIPVGTRGVNQSVLQTDAAINPGNSGGPLLDSAGRVIGVNTQILTGGSEQSAGVGFSIPVNVVRTLLPQLQAGKKISTPFLGVQYVNLGSLDAQALTTLKLPVQGALVGAVTPGSPAAKAGLKAGTQRVTLGDGTPLTLGGDVITQVDGQPIGVDRDLQGAVFSHAVGDTVKLTVLRDGKTLTLDVTLAPYSPPSPRAVGRS